MTLQRVFVLPDMHVPYHDKRTWKAVLKYLSEHEWDRGVVLGDFMDFDCISDHNRKKLRTLEGKTVAADYEVGNDVLDQLQNATAKGHGIYNCPIDYIEGNHEERVLRLLDEQPVLRGTLEVPTGLQLKERGIRWVPFWSKGRTLKIGKATFGHGLYIPDQHAKKHVLSFDTNFFYGHTHDHQLYSKVNNGDNKTKVGESLGCLCEYKQYWMKGRPNRWQQAFAEFWFLPNGYFNHYVVSIFNHQFVAPDGKVYKG